MSNFWSIVLAIPVFIGSFLLISTLAAILYSVPLVYLWNYAMTSMFGFSEVTVYQMATFLVLILIQNFLSSMPFKLINTFKAAPWTPAFAISAATPASETEFGFPH